MAVVEFPPPGERSPGGRDGTRVPSAPAWPELSIGARHGLVGDIVATIEPDTEADPAAILVSFLVAAGAAIGAGPFALADGAQHPARLHAVVVGDSSKARKGTSLRRTRPLLEAADPRWAAERILSGLSSGEGLIACVADPSEDKDGNPTGGVEDKRTLVVEEEFVRVLTVARREGNTLSAVLRQAWDDGRLRTMTKTPLVATGAHVCIIGHVTIPELRLKLTEVDMGNGVANRFIWACARRSKLLPAGGAGIHPDVVADLGRRTASALEVARKIGLVRRTREAEEVWSDLYTEMAEDDTGDLVGAITARAEAQVLRLSLVYALLDGSNMIDVDHLDAGWSVWCYCRDSARYIFGDSLGDEVADRLLAAVRNAGSDGLDGAAQSAVFARHVSAKRLEAARQVLLARHLVVQTKVETDGRPRMVLTAKEANQAKQGVSR